MWITFANIVKRYIRRGTASHRAGWTICHCYSSSCMASASQSQLTITGIPVENTHRKSYTREFKLSVVAFYQEHNLYQTWKNLTCVPIKTIVRWSASEMEITCVYDCHSSFYSRLRSSLLTSSDQSTASCYPQLSIANVIILLEAQSTFDPRYIAHFGM